MAVSDEILTMVIVVLSLNLIMWLVGLGMADLGGTNPFNYEDNELRIYNAGNSTNWDVSKNVSTFLPGGEATGISPDTGLSFTDIFTSIKTWIVDKTGLGFLLNMMSAPKIILQMMGLPSVLAGAITALWYGITLMIVVSFIWGR